MKVVFAGNAWFSEQVLRALVNDKNISVAWVYTSPDRPSGRGKKVKPTHVKAYAQTMGIDVFQPVSFGQDQADALEAAGVDVLVVASFGQILPAVVLSSPKWGGINVHTSLLPKWRGASPIASAILAGEKHSGVSIMKMDARLDAGDVLESSRLEIVGKKACEVEALMAMKGSALLVEVLKDLPGFCAGAQVQQESSATYCKKMKKIDAKIDWRDEAGRVVQHVLAYSDRPGAFSFLANGKRLKILNARVFEEPLAFKASFGSIVEVDAFGLVVVCGLGFVLITEAQLEGGGVVRFDGEASPPAKMKALKGNQLCNWLCKKVF